LYFLLGNRKTLLISSLSRKGLGVMNNFDQFIIQSRFIQTTKTTDIFFFSSLITYVVGVNLVVDANFLSQESKLNCHRVVTIL